MNTDTPQVDPTALSLSRAIRNAEGGDYTNTNGDNGTSAGAYQWNNGKLPLQKGQIPANFQSGAKQFGLDPTDFSPTNQDHVAYEQIKHDLDSGLSQSQIAAKWNSGLTHGWENHRGTTTINGKTISYDTPGYVAKVQSYYQQDAAKAGQGATGYNPTPYSNPSEATNPGAINYSGANDTTPPPSVASDSSLGGQLAGRVNDVSDAIGTAGTGTTKILKGDVGGVGDIASGALQTVGAAAGGLGDIVNKGLETIPFVKSIEGVIGDKVGQFAQTPGGQAVVKSLQDFAEKNPQLTKNAGAVFNIVTALPILKGLSVIKNVALDAASSALKGAAEKSATSGLTKVVSTTIGGRKALSKAPDGIKTLMDERALPDIENGKYSTQEAAHKLNDAIEAIDEKELQPILEQISAKQSFGQSLTTLKKKAIQEVEADTTLRESGSVPEAVKQIEKRFAGWQHSYGDTIDLATQNRLKIGTGKFTNWGTPEGSADKAMYRALQQDIEEVAKKNGMSDVDAINQKMARLIKAQGLLKHIEGKSVKTGLVGSLVQETAAAGGEALGNTVGVPLVGAYATYKAGGFIGKKLTGFSKGILERTGKGAVRQELSPKPLGGLVGGAFAQKAANAR